jgi:hypothetical protein
MPAIFWASGVFAKRAMRSLNLPEVVKGKHELFGEHVKCPTVVELLYVVADPAVSRFARHGVPRPL